MRAPLVSANCRCSFKRPRLGLARCPSFLPLHTLRNKSDQIPLVERKTADHRELGPAQDLFRATPASPGSVLFGPSGTHILLKLQQFLRAQYAQFGFQEVITPIIYKQSLWERSGHWQHYAEDMYEVVGRGARGETEGKELGEDEKYGLKPMNCPGHCLLYSTQPRSYRDLPVRYADFSPLHRNEVSGSLSGLTRVRRFHQDDGHIFCLPEQVGDEIKKCLQFVDMVYKVFGFEKYSLVLSTRPEIDYMGSIETWDRAEAQLKEALEESRIPWTLNPGDGAFYGPKIDIVLLDRTSKAHQTATIQLDFQLPERMDLQYRSPHPALDTNVHVECAEFYQLTRPVLIHRAVLGSLERFFALLIERTGGLWPVWLNPRQLNIVPLAPRDTDYAQQCAALVRSGAAPISGEPVPRPIGAENLNVQVYDDTTQSFKYRLRDSFSSRPSFTAAVGPNDQRQGVMTVDVTNVIDHAAHVPDVLMQLGHAQSAEKAREDPKRVPLTPHDLRQLITELSRRYL